MGDVARFSAAGIIALYHERWELEIGNDEIKTHLLDRQEAIRSRTPGGVRQEGPGPENHRPQRPVQLRQGGKSAAPSHQRQ